VIALRLARRVYGLLAITVLILVTPGCGSDDSASPTKATAAASTAKTAAPTRGLAGRWERVQTCRELSDALDQAGLSALAPAVLTDFFAGTSARQLAGK
jgi:hypothetical protein